MLLKLVYDESVTVSYGLWVCPDCGTKFYGGGRTMHRKGCPHLPNTMDYEGLELHFGPAQVQSIKEYAKRYGKDRKYYAISLSMLETQFPELV